MAESKENRGAKKHEFTLVGREKMRILGVERVIGFDGDYVELMTDSGGLYIEGENIHIGVLDTDSGQVELEGRIDSISYSDGGEKQKKSLFRRGHG